MEQRRKHRELTGDLPHVEIRAVVGHADRGISRALEGEPTTKDTADVFGGDEMPGRHGRAEKAVPLPLVLPAAVRQLARRGGGVKRRIIGEREDHRVGNPRGQKHKRQ